MRLHNDGFRYVPSALTDVMETWKRFGFRLATDEERRARAMHVGAAASSARGEGGSHATLPGISRD